MKVAWLADPGNQDGSIGGAELTQAEFRAQAPEGVETVTCAPGDLDAIRECDRACIFNTVTYPVETVRALGDKPLVRYWNDLAPHGDPQLRAWVAGHARNVFCSPLHRERFPWAVPADYELIPPPVDLERFRAAALSANGSRRGAVSVAAWMNPGKAAHLVQEWAAENGGVAFFGGGPYAPDGSAPVRYEQMPELLAGFETFVFLPTAVEPFGRTVVEAWAAGCEVVTNGLVGATYWIAENPDALETAGEDFWKAALA